MKLEKLAHFQSELTFLVKRSPVVQIHNAPVRYPIMHNFVAEMRTCVHISVTKWCFVWYMPNELWNLWGGSMVLMRKDVSMSFLTHWCADSTTETLCILSHCILHSHQVDKCIAFVNGNAFAPKLWNGNLLKKKSFKSSTKKYVFAVL